MISLSYDCTKHKEYAKHIEQQRLVQFLMGLNETYAQARSQVLLTVPVPTLNHAYNMIMQDESQRVQSNMISQVAPPLQQLDLNDPTTLASIQSNRFRKSNGNNGNSRGSRGPIANNVSCVEKSEGTSSIGSSSGPSSMPFFTPEQYHQLLKLIDKEPTISDARVNMAGIADFLNACFSVGSKTNYWDLYSGKVRRIGKEKDELYILQPAKIPSPVKVPETSSTPAFKSFIPSTIPVSTTPVPKSSSVSSNSCIHSFIWHQRFGHAPIAVLQKIPSLKNHLLNKDTLNCTVCPLARLPSSVFFGKSPYEVFHGHLPILDIIRVFRYLCYATTLNNTDKFSQRSRPAIFMGYSTSQKGYMLYNISTGTFFVSRDVSFMETVFPSKYPKSTFLHTLSSGSIPTFPTSVTASTYDDSFPALSPSIPAPDPPSPSCDYPLSQYLSSPSTFFPTSFPIHSFPFTSPISSLAPTSSPVRPTPFATLSSALHYQNFPPLSTTPVIKIWQTIKTSLMAYRLCSSSQTFILHTLIHH
ncbi:uncharacterized protein [Nicotiana sylvestris]|uniref:uncharacterized protein n=1 Tax=Nicotiana sylvestris TaxID=4096 RepID=UPI00388C5D30